MKSTRLRVRKKCEGFPIGISIPSTPRTGACCDRIRRFIMPFGCTIVIALLAGKEDGTGAALISLDQSKGFDRFDRRFLVTVSETAGFQPLFRRWISMMYHNPQAVVQVNGRHLGAFASECSVQQGCSLSFPLYVLAFEHLLRSLRDEKTNPALRGVAFCWPSYGKGVRVRRWYHSVCTPPPGYKGCEEGGWRG